MQKLQREMAPKLAAHSDAITLDPVLFARVSALYDKRDSLGLDPESKRLLWRYHQDFVRAGAKLGEADKEKLKALERRARDACRHVQPERAQGGGRLGRAGGHPRRSSPA